MTATQMTEPEQPRDKGVTLKRESKHMAPAVAAWRIEVTTPDGRAISMSVDSLIVDLAAEGPAARLGTEVTNLVTVLLDA